MSLSAVEVERILSNGERITTNSDEQKDDATKNSHNSHNSQPSELTKPDLNPLALYGLAGEIVRAVDPITESDMVATLTNLLAGFGNIVGPIPYVSVGDARHYLNIYVVQVGDTAKGRKGTAWATPAAMLRNMIQTGRTTALPAACPAVKASYTPCVTHGTNPSRYARTAGS